MIYVNYYEIMTDTKMQCESNPKLIEAVRNSIEKQYMISTEDNIDQPVVKDFKTQYVCSGKREN